MKGKRMVAIVALLLCSVAMADEDGPRWHDLSAEQREGLGQFADDWDRLPVERRDRRRRGAEG